jgi:predicted RNA-binding protein with PUA-like domain
MPTGYTADVQSGKVTEFADFALQCARNFGALILMRDEPHGTPIPDEFKPSTYNQKAADENEAEINRLRALGAAGVQEEYDREYKGLCAQHEKARAARREEKQRYEAMVAKVNEWKPPSFKHEGMKKFMLEQLQSSIAWDCSDTYESPLPKREDASVWLARTISRLYASIERNRKSQLEENERTAERNLWVKQLRESLSPVSATVEGVE